MNLSRDEEVDIMARWAGRDRRSAFCAVWLFDSVTAASKKRNNGGLLSRTKSAFFFSFLG